MLNQTLVTMAAIMAGAGFSNDTQSISPYTCFYGRLGRTDEMTTEGSLDKPINRYDLAATLGMNIT